MRLIVAGDQGLGTAGKPAMDAALFSIKNAAFPFLPAFLGFRFRPGTLVALRNASSSQKRPASGEKGPF
jgi:hypothetical protein